MVAKRRDSRVAKIEVAKEPQKSLYQDGLPERQTGEHCDAFEARLNAHRASVIERMDHMCANSRSTILLAFIRHLHSGSPASTFCYKDSDGLAICDYALIEKWKRDKLDEYQQLQRQIEIATRQCEARWVEHLANMASGRAGGNVKAMELYMKRFFNWDEDVSGYEEAKAACEMFRAMTSQFTKKETIDI